MNRFWQDAASIFETAAAVNDGETAKMAILVDERNGLRIVQSEGWTLEALRREYRASTAYTVTRTANSVSVEGQNADESCTFTKKLSAAALTNLGGYLPHHLIRPALLT